MSLGIEVLCESCGTELEIPDVTTDHLLKVTLKARPCPKCNRPPDCHLSCEDVLEKEKELVNLKAKLLSEKQNLKAMKEKISTLSSLIPIDEEDDLDEDEDEDE